MTHRSPVTQTAFGKSGPQLVQITVTELSVSDLFRQEDGVARLDKVWIRRGKLHAIDDQLERQLIARTRTVLGNQVRPHLPQCRAPHLPSVVYFRRTIPEGDEQRVQWYS